jgi:hypothetical protein
VERDIRQWTEWRRREHLGYPAIEFAFGCAKSSMWL